MHIGTLLYCTLEVNKMLPFMSCVFNTNKNKHFESKEPKIVLIPSTGIQISLFIFKRSEESNISRKKRILIHK